MDKKIVNTVLAVVLGIALFNLLTALAGLVSEVALTQDALDMGGSSKDIVLLMRWFGAATIFLLVAALVSYCLSYFGKSAIFQLSSASISLVTIICLIIFCSEMHAACGNTATSMATGIAFIQSLVQIMISTAVICVFYTLNSVKYFLSKKSQETNLGGTEDEEV